MPEGHHVYEHRCNRITIRLVHSRCHLLLISARRPLRSSVLLRLRYRLADHSIERIGRSPIRPRVRLAELEYRTLA